MTPVAPDPRTSRRPLGRGDLRLLLLDLLGQQPGHGYGLIQRVSALLGHAYTPSAGSVYPLLAGFEQQGWVTAEAAGGRRRYRIAAPGLAHLRQCRAEVESAQARARHGAHRVAKAGLPTPVREAMERLKQSLVLRHGHWQEADAERVAALLDEAAARISPLPQARALD